MHEELYPYYERELEYLRKSSVEFAQNYPHAASALRIEKDGIHDPHVERLLEGCAFLTARIRRKLDDEFPEISESLLELLYPQYVLPVAPLGIAQFQVDPQSAKLTTTYRIPKGTVLHSAPVGGEPCCFRTCYPVDLSPVAVDTAKVVEWSRKAGPETKCAWQAQAVLLLSLKALCGVTFGDFPFSGVRIFLQGAPHAYRLYELLGRKVVRIEVAAGDAASSLDDDVARGFFLPPESIRPVGFSDDDELMPFPKNAFTGYRLLREFFVFPEKFLFYDIDFGAAIHSLGSPRSITIRFYLESMPENPNEIGSGQFALGCAPIVNLFEKNAEPQKTYPARHEYRVVPEAGKSESFEVYSVNGVETTDLVTGVKAPVEPFYAFRHALQPTAPFYWYTRREVAADKAEEVFLELCSLGYSHLSPENQNLSMTLICSNRNLVRDMELYKEGRTDFTALNLPFFGPIKALALQRDVIRTPLGRDDEYWTASDATSHWRGGYWRLISHLSLNYLSLETAGIEALQALLQLYDVKGEAKNENIIRGLTGLVVRHINRLIQGSLCRGIEIELTIDVDRFKESSFYLLAAVLDRFFALYVSINSFSQLIVVDNTERRNRLKQWPIRMGEQKTI